MPTSTILFVDDDIAVLNGMERSLYKMRAVWQMDFAGGGAEAMQRMRERSYDLLVTDIRMPDVDGVELLSWAQRTHPQTLRFVLSGQSDSKHLEQIMGLTHQFLTKPCRADSLKMAIQRAEQLRFLLVDAELQRLVNRMKGLPILPTVLAELTTAVTSADQSLRRVAEIIGRDMGLAAKVLQLVNSPLFGLRQQVNDPHQAVVLLGLDTIKTLILAASTFDALQDTETSALAEEICDHAARVGWIARCIAKDRGDENAVNWALAGSLLHDVGKLILNTQIPDLAIEAAELAQAENIPLFQAEVEIFGQTHAEIGAYLLGIWGFDERLVAAIATHHRRPPAMGHAPLSLSAVIYLADLLEHAWFPTSAADHQIDLSPLDQLGITEEQLTKWFACFQPTIGLGDQESIGKSR